MQGFRRQISPIDAVYRIERGGAESATETVAKSILAEKVKGVQLFFQDLFEGKLQVVDVLFTIFALIAIGLAASVMVLEDGLLLDALAWTCVFMSSSAAILQRKVSLLEGFRKITNQLRSEVNKMNESNDNLRKQNQRLAKSSKKLADTTSTLEAIGAASGMSVDRLVSQVQQYKEIQASIKADLRSKIKQTLLGAMMQGDENNDGAISAEETDRLVVRLNLMPGVEFNEARFRQVLKNEGGDIMQFASKHFEEEQVVEKERIFIF